MSLNIVSVNVSGLREKQNTAISLAKTMLKNIITLQETHSYFENDDSEWSREWTGKAIWSSSLNIEIIKAAKDPHGR